MTSAASFRALAAFCSPSLAITLIISIMRGRVMRMKTQPENHDDHQDDHDDQPWLWHPLLTRPQQPSPFAFVEEVVHPDHQGHDYHDHVHVLKMRWNGDQMVIKIRFKISFLLDLHPVIIIMSILS